MVVVTRKPQQETLKVGDLLTVRVLTVVGDEVELDVATCNGALSDRADNDGAGERPSPSSEWAICGRGDCAVRSRCIRWQMGRQSRAGESPARPTIYPDPVGRRCQFFAPGERPVPPRGPALV